MRRGGLIVAIAPGSRTAAQAPERPELAALGDDALRVALSRMQLIRKFEEVTGVPVLLNTSFNENEPIVQTPAQAIDCFLRTRMDMLSIGGFVLYKEENTCLSDNRIAFADLQRT